MKSPEIFEKYLKEFAIVADKWFRDLDWFEERSLFYKNFFDVKKIENYKWEDFQELRNNLHSFSSMPLAGSRALGRINMPIEKYREIFIYIIESNDDTNVIFNNLKTKGSYYYLHNFGESTISELLSYAHPEKYFIYNKRTIDVIKHLGINIENKKGDKFGEKYSNYNNYLHNLYELYENIVEKKTNTSVAFELDQFFSWFYETKLNLFPIFLEKLKNEFKKHKYSKIELDFTHKGNKYIWLLQNDKGINNSMAHYELYLKKDKISFEIHFEQRKTKNSFYEIIGEKLPEKFEWYSWSRAKSIRYTDLIELGLNINYSEVYNLLMSIDDTIGDVVSSAIKQIKLGNSNVKEEFKRYLVENNKKGSQRASSYIRALELLDKILISKAKDKLNGFDSIYKIKSIDVLNKLYEYILVEQKKEDGIFLDEKPKSYWQNYFYSAAINAFIDFLKLNMGSNVFPEVNKELFSFISFMQNCNSSNLKYSSKLITRYTSSLITKPFVLLSGLSGSGKTKLAQSFAQWISADESQYCIIPVGADWTNREPLLGYVNALDEEQYIIPENGALHLLIEANKEENSNKPYFLILDEMNLSHVERYFADFLSVMESKDKFKLHSKKDEEISGVPHELSWPKNLFVVGTVNIDETTYMFSPKVLDRANVIEFRVDEKEIKDFLSAPEEVDLSKLIGNGASMANSFVDMAKNTEFDNVSKKLNETLVHFFVELKKTGAEFGYRTAMEIHRLYYQMSIINTDLADNEKIDFAIMQKLLPKLHGSRSKLVPVLKTLAVLCYASNDKFTEEQKDKVFETIKNDSRTIRYSVSLEKITRMYHNVVINGFTSYAEA